MNWFYSIDHLALLGLLFVGLLVVRGLDRLLDLLDSFHDDYRKVNNLDEREESQSP
jgi:hypothetical protein